MAELLLGRPLFKGKSDLDQLTLVLDLMGTPTEEVRHIETKNSFV